MTTVSVVVPCYNVEQYVKKCLDSLINQTLHDIEIICIDDKSTDNTLKILQDYAKQDKRIKLFTHSKNQGVAVARNLGIKHATGRYLGFVDPDDWVDLDFYEKLYIRATETKADIAKGRYKIFDVLTKQTRLSDLNTKIEKNRFCFTSEHQTAIFLKDFLNKYTLRYPTDVITGQDSVFLSMVCVRYPSIVCVDNAIYNYIYNRPGSLDSVTLNHEKVLSRLKMLDYKINILKTANFANTADKDVFQHRHLIYNFIYLFNKSFEQPDDKYSIFMWLRKNAGLFSKSVLHTRFTKQQIKTIVRGNFFLFCHPEYRELIYKKRFDDGRREIYVLGKKIFSYRKKK